MSQIPHFNHTIGSLTILEHFQSTAFNIGVIRGHNLNINIIGINSKSKDIFKLAADSSLKTER
jgi:hypothetical protein